MRGNERPEVYLFTRQKEALQASLIHREDDYQKGLALLWVKADEQTLTGLSALSLGSSFGLQGREEVTLIGFPDGTLFWTVTPGSIARREGRNLVFSRTLSTGNSGGPVLPDGRVVGLVTDLDSKFGHAVQAESIALYIRGVDPDLADLTAAPTKKTLAQPAPAPEFCRALAKLTAESKNGFQPIKLRGNEDKSRADAEQISTVIVPGTELFGWIRGSEEAYYYFLSDTDKQKVARAYNVAVPKVKHCLSGWEQSQRTVLKDRKYSHFRESDKGTVISVQYNLAPQNKKYYYLTLRIYPPGNNEW